MAGMNRSAALLVGYLMHDHGLVLEDAALLTATRRGWILSNEDFVHQLVKLADEIGKLAPGKAQPPSPYN